MPIYLHSRTVLLPPTTLTERSIKIADRQQSERSALELPSAL